MESLTVIFQRTNGHDLPLPDFETSGSSGIDIKANLSNNITLEPGSWQVISTRSGLANKHGITIF